MKEKLTYFADEGQYPFFFTEKLFSVVSHLDKALPHMAISIYPDATLKTNGLPTGILCSSSIKEAILMPFVLRDPGCGYLMFKLRLKKELPSDWNQKAGSLLDNISTSKRFNETKKNVLNTIDFNGIANQGLLGILNLDLKENDLDKFIHTHFKVDTKKVIFSNEEVESLTDDFMKVTNTIEIRKLSTIQQSTVLKAYSINENDYIGFIHSGSHFFPRLLGEKFVYRICEYAHKNKLFNLDDIDKGIVGIPLNSSLGKDYETWLYAAMNYALVSRYYIYKVIKQELELAFPCEISLINDNIHAGLFEKKTSHEHISYSVRGVQNISKNYLSLLAGQRETPAALVVGGTKAEDYANLFAHGTGYHICDNFDYINEFTSKERECYLSDAQHTFYNSVPNFEECLPYTYNLYASLKFFDEINLTETVAYLSPFINIQSEWLKNLN